MLYCANGLHDRAISFKIAYHFLIPPPPPAAEVEAYGFLEWNNEFAKKREYVGKNLVAASQVYIEQEDNARRFYSQPATSEVLKEYLKSKHNHSSGFGHMTLDQFISWYKEAYTGKLLFTAAALKELGVK